MPTQIIVVDRSKPLPSVALRNDVDGLLIVVTNGCGPEQLTRVNHPRTRTLPNELVPRAVARPARARSDGYQGRASIVVCTHNRPEDLARCLEALLPASRAGHQVIVVDNDPSTNASREVVEHYGFCYEPEPRRGLNRARNTGLAAATHEVVAYVDDDVVVDARWIDRVLERFADDAIGCVTGLVLPLELESRGQEWFETYCAHRRDFQPRDFSSATLPPSAAGVVGMGANMAFRRQALISAGGFDERLDAGTRTHSGGDTDMFARVLDAGHHIAYSPDAFVWHRHRRTEREVRWCVFGYGVGLSSLLTKRVFEQGDLLAVVTGMRWLIGPVVKALIGRVRGRPVPPWSVVFAELAGGIYGPIAFVREAAVAPSHRR